ncbi:MAG TPA: VIT domain-containing protein [Verrucomicrobiae bacterium]|nr:VIT domain-containing protein [Verrucomicrobiae bacterium]
MIQWTEPARRLLNEYCARSRPVLAGAGADVEEVNEDLRRHVEEEVGHAGVSLVTEEDVRRILVRMGEPPESLRSSIAPPARASATPGVGLLFPGVFLPLITFLVEAVFAPSAGALFDPFPTWLHWVAVAAVPVINWIVWKAAREQKAAHPSLLAWSNAAALGICIYYSVMYIGFIPYAFLAVIFFGSGLLPLAPYIALGATAVLGIRYRRSFAPRKFPRVWIGVVGSIALLLLVQFPTAATYYGLAKSTSEDPDTRAHGIRVLRWFGDREVMLRACYGSLRRELNIDLIRAFASDGRDVSADQAREAFYRATGRPFNSEPPPELYTRAGRWTMMEDEFAWDEGLGGQEVAQRVKGLSLMSSRMDAVAEPDAALVYCEWIMEFKNVSRMQREARAQVALPPGAVVSRVTLWIDGEEREAAFGTRSQARKAYEEVAVVQRRDPILVTTCGPDRVLMQCFPVPPNGGVMKVKLGMTVPLILPTAERGQFLWPKFIERNFALQPGVKHDLWIESTSALANGISKAAQPQSATRPFALRAAIPDSELSGKGHLISVARDPLVTEVFANDDTGETFRQRVQPRAARKVKRVAIVVDGSSNMEPHAQAIAAALDKVPAELEAALFIAGHDGESFSETLSTESTERQRVFKERISRTSFQGGQDNVPALEAAWDLVSQTEDGCVLWIHGPEPVLLSSENGLRQRLERNPWRTRIIELQAGHGPDRLIEKLDGYTSIERTPRMASFSDDAERVVDSLTQSNSGFELKRERTKAAAEGRVASLHVKRLWARDESLRLSAAHQQQEAGTLAARNQLVTPLTGAVVLETKEQYDRHGLSPAEAGTVPSVPEPAVYTVFAIGLFAWLLLRRRNQRVTSRVGRS